MRRFVVAGLLMIGGVLAAIPLHAQIASHPRGEMNVYVAPLEGPDATLAETVRTKLVKELEKHGITVVDQKDSSCAVLTGSDLMQSSFATSWLGHHPTMRIRASLRLVNKNGVTLWAGDVSSGRYAVSETGSFVDNAAGKIATALSAERRRERSEPVAQ